MEYALHEWVWVGEKDIDIDYTRFTGMGSFGAMVVNKTSQC